MYASHQGGQSIRTMVSAPHASYTWNGAPAALRGLSSSASLKGKTLTLTVTNPSLDAVRDTEIVVRGGRIQSLTGRMLAANDVHAHNSFEDPRAVEPKTVPTATATAGKVNFTFPAASVSKIEIALG